MDTTQPATDQIPAIDFSPYVPLSLLASGALDPEVARSIRGWPRARWIITEDAAGLDAATQAELLAVLRRGAAWDQRFLLVTADPAALAGAFAEEAPPNVGVLAHVTTQAQAEARLPGLLRCRAAVRGVLVRPPAEPIDLSAWLSGPERLDWVIAAGVDTPINVRRFEDLRRQCAAANVAFFFDGWGAWVCISEVYPGETEDAEQAGAWYREVGDPADLPTLTYRVGPRFRPTLNDRLHRKTPEGWGVPWQRSDVPFAVGETYLWDTIAAYVRTTRFADPSPLDEDQDLGDKLMIQSLDGARLAAFAFTGDDEVWRCTAIGDALPAWAVKLLEAHREQG